MTDPEAGHDRPVAQAWGFFALTYLWSWSSWGLAIASGAEWTDLPAVLFYVVGGFGPSCVAVLLV